MHIGHAFLHTAGALLAVMLAVAPAMCAAAKPVPAQPAPVPFVLDGLTEERAYVGADWSDNFTVMDPENKEIHGQYLEADRKFTQLWSRASVFFDATNLYVCVLAPFPADMAPGAEDRVECHFVPNWKKGKTAYRITAYADGRLESGKYAIATLKEQPWAAVGASVAVDIGKKGAACFEYSIPFAAFGADAAPASGWRCNFIRRGPGCGGLSSLAPTDRELVAPGKFVPVAFGKLPPAAESGPPLPENLGKQMFFWGADKWMDSAPTDAPPLHAKELSALELSGFRGTRAVGAVRVSNLTDRHALYNLDLVTKDTNLYSRIRFREMGYVELRSGETIPDPIFDLPIGGVLRIPPKTTAILWTDVDCTGLEPGEHSGSISFMPGYGKRSEKRLLPLRLVVHRANLDEIDFPVFFYHQDRQISIAKDYGMNVVTLRPYRHFNLPGPDGKYDFSALDAYIAKFVAAGLPKDRMYVALYTMIHKWLGFKKADGKRARFLDPDWKAANADRLRAVVKHLRERHGFGYDRIFLSTLDEPHGDVTVTNSTAYAALKGGEFVKSVDPNLRIWCNPWKNEAETVKRLLEVYDILEPNLPRIIQGITPDTPELCRRSGKYICSYCVYVKQNTPHQYRRVFWANLDYGFQGWAAIYGLTASCGDPFNSYDGSVKNPKCVSDWNSGYWSKRTGMVTPGRRLEAWYHGLVDSKLIRWCRIRLDEKASRGEDVSALSARLDETIHEGNAAHVDLEELRERLVKLSETLAGPVPEPRKASKKRK